MGMTVSIQDRPGDVGVGGTIGTKGIGSCSSVLPTTAGGASHSAGHRERCASDAFCAELKIASTLCGVDGIFTY